MNPAIEQAVEAARTHKLFLSERRSLASTYSPHIIISSQSSSLNKDSGVQSMEDESPYNRYSHHPPSQENVPGVMHDGMNGFHSTWTASPTRQRKSPSHGHTLPNGYRRNRRASLPGISLFESERVGNPEVVARSSPRTSKQHRGRMGRRGSYDQRMLNETYPVSTHHASMSGDIPGMTYIPEQNSDEAESAYRPHDPNRHRSSRSQNNLTEIPRYGIYREHDANGEMGYEPSSPSSALPRARQTGANQPQRSPRHRRQVGSPQSSSSSSRTSTPRDDYYQEDAGTNIIFEESDLHHHHHHHRRQQQKYRQRSASGSSKLLKVQDLGSEERAGSTVQLQRTGNSEHRRRAHSIPHLNRVGTPESTKPGILKDVWNESKPVNGSAEISTPRTNVKANLNRSPRDNPTSTGKSAKKSNFLTGSLRNIFFGKSTGYGRKRGSHVVELDDTPSHSTNSSTTESTTTQMKSDTYQDEDGQPCSNV
ncbi:probable voltage-dependent N-type calcium channel subunit alpha-1B [Patiria miniata]|uniref:Uncharacterized protein n=1 Tax=Patiria miniata TaxID=46514 RepID=A0A914BGU3_PATMI|nr:probable voltage-dependent N-type calcium channel subunit alpha-1B [Patiria miniata]